MEEMDKALLRGRCIRFGVVPAPGGLDGAEGRRWTSLKAIKKEEDSYSRNPGQIEAEIIHYCEALFQR